MSAELKAILTTPHTGCYASEPVFSELTEWARTAYSALRTIQLELRRAEDLHGQLSRAADAADDALRAAEQPY